MIVILCRCQMSSKCTESITVNLHASFVTLVNSTDRDTTLSGLEIYGVGREDSILTTGKTSVRNIDLPLAPDRDSCSYVFLYNSIADTLCFSYIRTVRLLSFECGFIQEYHDLKVTTTFHHLDSVAVINSLVTNTDDENLKIYLFRH